MVIMRVTLLLSIVSSVYTFSQHTTPHTSRIRQSLIPLSAVDNNDEAQRYQEKANELRDQIRSMESKISDKRSNNNALYIKEKEPITLDDDNEGKSLKNKRVLVVGANGRLGSMVTRHLLRTHGEELKEVVAAVHYVGQATSRGWGRLSYEVGAEDGVGSIGAAWSPEDERNASFEFDPVGGYYLNKLRLVEVELLDPVQVRTITEDVDAIIYCATDFEGNRPRAVASLNAAFLFRAVAAPTKGRVEIEGLQNCLEGLVGNIQEQKWKNRLEPGADIESTRKSSDPTQFVLVSSTPDALGKFETPFGEFNALKRQGEYMVKDFPSISYTILQMGKYDDNFVEEGQELQYAEAEDDTEVIDGVVSVKESNSKKNGMQKRINRRDAARAAVEALTNEEIDGKKVQVYTEEKKSDIW